MARRTRDQRRLDYLEIGVELLSDGPARTNASLALAHVRIADVARTAGVTKGALYHLWDSQEDYWDDLLAHLLAEGRLTGFANVPELTRELAERAPEFPSTVEWANFVFDRFKDDPSFFARIGLLSYVGDGELRAELEREFDTSLAEFEAMTALAVERLGRRARPDTSLHELSTQVASLLYGLLLEHRIDPARTPDIEIDGERVTMFAECVVDLVDAFTEVAPPGTSTATTGTAAATPAGRAD